MKQFEDTPYYITRDGRVFRGDRELKQENMKKGYKRVTFSIDGKTKRYAVHRLVAMIYIPNPENKPFVNHIDHNPSNNHVDNLEWVTHSENMLHCVRHNRGTHKLATQASIDSHDRRLTAHFKELLGDSFIKTFNTDEISKKGRRFVVFNCPECGVEHTSRSDSSIFRSDNICCFKCSYMFRK